MKTIRIGEPVRWALAALALANIGIGLILIGTDGIGPVTTVVRDIFGWALIALAIPSAIQCYYGLMHRAQEEILVANAGLLGCAAYHILTGDSAPHPVTTMGMFVVAVSTCVGCILLWSRISGRRLGEQYRRAREASRRKGQR